MQNRDPERIEGVLPPPWAGGSWVVRGPQRGVERRGPGADHGERVIEHLGQGTSRPVHVVKVDRLVHPVVREIVSPVKGSDRAGPLGPVDCYVRAGNPGHDGAKRGMAAGHRGPLGVAVVGVAKHPD